MAGSKSPKNQASKPVSQTVTYQGKKYEILSTYRFNDRKFYRLKGLTVPVSENLLDTEG